MSEWRRYGVPLAAGLVGSLALAGLYFGLVSLAESPIHAWQQAWQDRWIITPLILGFGVQVGLFAVLKTGAYLPVAVPGSTGVLTGASGGMSATAMVACCAHHLTDILPLVGLTAASTFLAQYRIPFMLVGLGTTSVGIAVAARAVFKARRSAVGRFFRAAASLLLAAVIAGCGPAGAPPAQGPAPAEASAAEPAVEPSPGLTRFDGQGAVEVTVVPRNLGAAEADELEFEIAMNTHSVDLSMDLAPLSSLESDLGVRVAADSWSGGTGHHVLGVLRFPLRDGQGLSVLEGASLLVLRIEGVDASVREFQWALETER